MKIPVTKEALRIWCDQHDRAPEPWDKWPRLIPKRVSDSPNLEADMKDFDNDGAWRINLKEMSCGDAGFTCMDEWYLSVIEDVDIEALA